MIQPLEKAQLYATVNQINSADITHTHTHTHIESNSKLPQHLYGDVVAIHQSHYALYFRLGPPVFRTIVSQGKPACFAA